MSASLAAFSFAHFFAQSSGTSNGLLAFLPLVVIMVIFYVLLILPAQRRQKKTQAMLGALKNGDKVVTNGGIYGTIVGLEADTLQLKIGDAGGTAVRVKVARSAISSIQPGEAKES